MFTQLRERQHSQPRLWDFGPIAAMFFGQEMPRTSLEKFTLGTQNTSSQPGAPLPAENAVKCVVRVISGKGVRAHEQWAGALGLRYFFFPLHFAFSVVRVEMPG